MSRMGKPEPDRRTLEMGRQRGRRICPVITSYRLGNDSSSRGDAAGQDGDGTQASGSGQQAGTGSEGQGTADGREDQQTAGAGGGQQATGGSGGQQAGNDSEDRQTSGGAGKQQTSGGGDTAAGEAKDPAEPGFASEKTRKYTDVEWKPVSYEVKVPLYKVQPDLSMWKRCVSAALPKDS